MGIYLAVKRGFQILLALFILLQPVAARAQGMDPFWPAQKDISGTTAIDASSAGRGYVTCSYAGQEASAYVRIQKNGASQSYLFPLDTNGRSERFPLNMGSGSYSVELYAGPPARAYPLVDRQAVRYTASGDDRLLPYLYPNAAVYFTADSAAVAQAKQLAAQPGGELDFVRRVYAYVSGGIAYDHDLHAQLENSGRRDGILIHNQLHMLPANADETLRTGKGICSDFAVLMAVMLRSQGVPAKINIGVTDGDKYHTWVSVYIRERGWVWYDPTAAAADPAHQPDFSAYRLLGAL